MYRNIWRHYIHNANDIIFVVDSRDSGRFDEVRDFLHLLLEEEELRSANLLFFANKQDLPNALKPEDLATELGLNNITDRSWHVQGTCAVTGEGLFEGLDWLGDQISRRQNEPLT